MSPDRGSALPAALVLLLVLHVVALQAALTAATARLAVARTAAAEEASRAAEAAILRAASLPAADLQAALAAGGPVALPGLARFLPAGARAEVRPRDDQEGDGDPRRDRNGRLLLVARAWSPPPAAGAPAERSLVQEALVGGATPLPAALLDCAVGVRVCAGEAGCPPPAARLDGGMDAAGMAVPAALVATARARLFVLARENLRRAAAACAGAPACSGANDALLRAAATDLIRTLDDPAGDALGLPLEGVLRLVENLLPLPPDAAGPGEVIWWDGLRRAVADRAVLVSVVEGLHRATGHLPELGGHPLPRLLAGRAEWQDDAGLCGRLPALQQAALRQAEPLPAGSPDPAAPARAYVEAGDRTLAPGEILEGSGLLVVQGSLEVPPTAVLRWRGVVLLAAGGRLGGGGAVEVDGGVVVAPAPPAEAAMDLMDTPWKVTADAARAAAAWEIAGIVLLSRWEPLPGE